MDYKQLRKEAEAAAAAKGVAATPDDYRRDRLALAEIEVKRLNQVIAAGKAKDDRFTIEDINKLRDQLALERSIGKWQDIVRGVGADSGGRNCALCIRHKNPVGVSCENCVVFKKVNSRGCNKTPFVEWLDHHDTEHDPVKKTSSRNYMGIILKRKVECETCVEIAVREVNFLKSCKDSVVCVPKHTYSFQAGTVSPAFYTEA